MDGHHRGWLLHAGQGEPLEDALSDLPSACRGDRTATSRQLGLFHGEEQVAAEALAFVFGFIGLFYNPMLIFIAFFVFIGAQQEAAMAQMKDISLGVPVSEAMVTHLVKLTSRATLDDAVEAMLRTSQHEFPVVDDHDAILGVLIRDDLIAALKRHGMGALVVDHMRRDLPVVTLDQAFDDAFREMQECGCPALPVVDRLGRFVGLITPENVGELMMVRSLRPAAGRPVWRPA